MRAVFVGEGMLELSSGNGQWTLGYGGDTLNTAIHLARAGVSTGYLTALGDDPFSANLRRQWAGEGLDCSLILTDSARAPGLYAITNDPVGERTFTYWRDDSAARQLMSCPGIENALSVAARADLLAFSLITLAILPPAGRSALLDLARQVRARGGKVAFDGNYRARLWPDAAEARRAADATIACCDIGLPTLDDEIAMGHAQAADEVAARWRALGCTETIVKLGGDGCLLPDGAIIAPPERLSPVDTSGAGDAFNAGYLAVRLRGDSLHAAAIAGHRLAGWTIMRPGAIPALNP